MRYVWEQPEWPKFRWDELRLAQPLADLRHEQGRLFGRMESLGFALREEALLQTLTQDVLTTSEIEGETLDAAQTRSSLARRLGIDIGALAPADRHVDGIVEMLLDATRNFADPLTADRLFGWHTALFPTGRTSLTTVRVGAWRDDTAGPMQVVSGPIGRERVHYTAPPAERLDTEMGSFLEWFNGESNIDPVLKAALAHLWFVTVHPFDDGNGRVARAIADLALARSEKSVQRFYSMSAQIQAERHAYYTVLEQTQHGTVEVTRWMEWFLGCLHRAIEGAEATLRVVLSKAQFWQRHATEQLNARQVKVLNHLLDGLEGKLTSSKWARIGKCSQDTAMRDIMGLVELKILSKGPAGGRSTSYVLIAPSDS